MNFAHVNEENIQTIDRRDVIMNTILQDAYHSNDGIRKAVYLDLATEHQHNIENFPFSDWSVDRVTSPPRAQSTINNQHYFVGLVYLSHLTQEQQNNIIDLIGHKYGTIWIAIVEEEDLSDSSFRRMIYEHFYDYFTLPLGKNLKYLKATLGHAYGIALLRSVEENNIEHIKISEMVGLSAPMRNIFNEIRKVANVDAPVLIGGETGTGKEMVARAIHQRSSRCDKPFVAVNCGALPDSLIHAELFGYEKGAFTGAYKRKIGRLEAAQNGTIFLDEIGDLPLDLQVYLLRFLEEHTIERLGGNDSHLVNARVIAATHLDLEKAVEEGLFREDLYYRLNVLNIQIPTLAERYEDIELLAQYFYTRFAHEYASQSRGFTKQAIEAMKNHTWPGNIREMINRVRRALVMSENRLITPLDLGLSQPQVSHNVVSLEEARNQAEELAIRSSMHYTQGNVSKTAKILGVSRVTLYRMLEKYDLR